MAQCLKEETTVRKDTKRLRLGIEKERQGLRHSHDWNLLISSLINHSTRAEIYEL